MKTVSRIMTPAPHTVSADLPIGAAKQLMGTLGIRHLPVLDQGKLVGLLSDRELPFAAKDANVGDAMNPGPYVTSSHASLRVVARDMAAHRFDAAVVLDEGRVVGIVTAVDLAAALAAILLEDELPAAPSCDRYGVVVG